MFYKYISGTNASETIDAADGVTSGPDWIKGGGGHDTVFGLGGDDALWGGEGNDTLNGGR
jgi:Ca2+-binding RTX toxin-like protein